MELGVITLPNDNQSIWGKVKSQVKTITPHSQKSMIFLYFRTRLQKTSVFAQVCLLNLSISAF